MAHYDITYTCGHTDRINLIGPHQRRAARIAYLESGACFECYKTEQHQVARAQAEEMDLPPLVGTGKQVAWAESLRIALLGKIEAEMAALEERANPDRQRTPAEADAERQILHALAVITAEPSAHWWIDHRTDDPVTLIREVARAERQKPSRAEAEEAQAAKAQAAADAALVLAAATVRPEQPKTATVAEIRLSGQVVSVTFAEKRDDFREVVKGLGYAWNDGRWQRTIGRFAGTPCDRAAELGQVLLAAGFCIRILDDTLRASAVAGTYTPECTRWVRALTTGPHAGWFVIVWARSEDYYAVARKIINSRYDAPQVVAPPEQFEQVLDFAQRYGFQVSDGAHAIVTLAQAAKEQMLVVQPAPRKKATKAEVPSAVPPVLTVPEHVDIAAELQDV